MAWKELTRSGVYHVGLLLGGRKFSRSLNTDNEGEADSAVACIEENLRLVERGRLEIPTCTDVMSFLLSNGKVSAPISVKAVTLRELFDQYFAALPSGNLEDTTIYTMKVHRRSLEGYYGKSKLVEAIDVVALQEYIAKRSNDRGLSGPLSPVTIRK